MMFIPSSYKNKKFALLGLGITGESLLKHLNKFGIEPICWDDDEAKRKKFEGKGVKLFNLTDPIIWKELDILLISPGIPFLYPKPHPVVKLARENFAEVDTDIGLFFKFLQDKSDFEKIMKPTVICITGSNGKSTTTALINHILCGISRDVEMGGNIGRPVMDLTFEKSQSVKVIELSSYQIEIAKKLEPDIAIFLNLANDHLERHGGLGGYFLSKSKLFYQGNPKYSIVGVDQNEGKFLANSLESSCNPSISVIQISTNGPILGSNWSVFISKNFIIESRFGKEIFKSNISEAMQIPGEHNRQNACAAYAACRALGYNPEEAFEQICSFKGLPHRTEIVRKLDGVVFVNDSKATNVESSVNSLKAFDNIRWIAGGLKKEGDVLNFNKFYSKIKKVYLIGSSAIEFSSSLKDLTQEISGELQIAVSSAYKEADPGDTVLLSPGCASFDQFKNFEERGDKFCNFVNELKIKT